MRATITSYLLALSVLIANPAFAVGEGEPAPDFSLPVLGEESTRSLSDSHGKVRYLDFWASWCPPCRVSIPEIVTLQEELGGSRFEVIGINVDERLDDAMRFLGRYPVNYENLSESAGRDRRGLCSAGYAHLVRDRSRRPRDIGACRIQTGRHEGDPGPHSRAAR